MILLSLASLSGCAERGTLIGEIETDLVAYVDFDAIWLQLDDAAPSSVSIPRAGSPLDHGARLERGLEPGRHRVRVWVSREGAEVVSRSAVLEVEGVTAVRFLLQRSCAGVVCDAGATCLNGTCALEGCLLGTEPECPATLCRDDTECGVSALCRAGRCDQGLCLEEDSCGSGEYCAEEGCVALPATEDGGVDDDGGEADAAVDAAIDGGDPEGGVLDAAADAGPCPGELCGFAPVVDADLG